MKNDPKALRPSYQPHKVGQKFQSKKRCLCKKYAAVDACRSRDRMLNMQHVLQADAKRDHFQNLHLSRYNWRLIMLPFQSLNPFQSLYNVAMSTSMGCKSSVSCGGSLAVLAHHLVCCTDADRGTAPMGPARCLTPEGLSPLARS